MNLITILVTAAITSIIWLVYIKFFQKKDNSEEIENLRLKEEELKNQKHQMELLEAEKNSEADLLKEKINSLEILKSNVEDSLKTERATSAEQLKNLGKVDEFKTVLTTNMTEHSKMIKDQQTFIDKLTGNSKYQGDFGEKFLEQSLQFHGFKLGIDYTKQKKEEVLNIEDDTTQTVKPDIVINLADGNHIICDSKVSLDNWKKFVMATDDQEKDEQFKKHALAVRKHIDDLSKKDYMKNLKKDVFEKVIMYMCHEAAYLAALEHFPDLYEYAYKKNILLVGPKNLLAIISIVQTIKDKEKQINGVKEITTTANHLMEKYSVLKKYLIQTMTTFNSHGESLKKVINGAWAGKASLEQRIEKLQDQGINPSTPIPKTTPMQDKLLEFEENLTKDKDNLN